MYFQPKSNKIQNNLNAIDYANSANSLTTITV